MKEIPWKAESKLETKAGLWLSGATLVTALTQIQESMAELEDIPFMTSEGMEESIQSKMIHSLHPVIDAIQSLSYPVGLLPFSCGMLLIIIGQRNKGLNLMTWASISYIGMQFASFLFKILVNVSQKIAIIPLCKPLIA
jgi:hypothetical protein